MGEGCADGMGAGDAGRRVVTGGNKRREDSVGATGGRNWWAKNRSAYGA